MLLGGGCSYIQNKALQTPSISKKEGAWEYEQKCPQGIKTFLYHLNLLSFLYSRLELYTLTVLLYNKRHHFWWSNHKGTARQFRPAIQRLDMHLKWPLVMQNLQEWPNSLQFLHRQCFTKLKAAPPNSTAQKIERFYKERISLPLHETICKKYNCISQHVEVFLKCGVNTSFVPPVNFWY